MRRKLIYSLSLASLLCIFTYRANASGPFLQESGTDGIVSMEAENFDDNRPGTIHTWELVTLPLGASDSNAMQALPDAGYNFTSSDNYLKYSPRLDFKVSFVKTGLHYVWIRGYASNESSDSCHAGLDDWADPNGKRIKFDKIAEWGWFDTNDSSPPKRATLDVKSTGIHTVNIWMRKDGAIVDKIVLTTNSAYTLSSGEGPPESARANPNPLSVDDFENYSATNEIFKTWIGGNSNPGNGTGSTIPYVEQAVAYVYGGEKSMPYYYDNAKSPYYSEAEADTANLGIDPNWTREGIKALALHFRGDPTNDANATERMYVALEDSAGHIAVVPYDGDANANDVQKTSWQEWNIKLTDFNNVELNSVKKVYIGFGNRNTHPAPGGSGLVYFDDIWLYPTRCVPSRVKGNFNDDCVVDYADLEIMRDNWLSVIPPHYTFTDFALLADSWLKEILWP
jgi:hypothetical protein